MASIVRYGIVQIVSIGPTHAAIIEEVPRREFGTFETEEEAKTVSEQLGEGYEVRELQGPA